MTLLYFDGCPNWKQAEDVVRRALAQLGLPGNVLSLRRVETVEEAERLSFHGSPTVLVNGRDPFAEPSAPIGLMCRVYRTAAGVTGAPTRDQVIAALKAEN